MKPNRHLLQRFKFLDTRRGWVRVIYSLRHFSGLFAFFAKIPSTPAMFWFDTSTSSGGQTAPVFLIFDGDSGSESLRRAIFQESQEVEKLL